MAMTPFTADVEVIQALNDRPNANTGLTADQLKAKFDQAPSAIKDYINNILLAELPIEFATKAELIGLILGQIPDGTITTAKLANGAVNFAKQSFFQFSGDQLQINNGTGWVDVGADPTLSNYFGQYGSFPFAGASDVTISTNTTWNDAEGYKRVKKLTIAAGVTLRIMQTPFFIFADEIVFGDTASTIDASGPSGADTGNFSDIFAMGATSGTGGAAYRVQGGCGGGMLFIVAKKISGAAGRIKANGGNGYVNNITFTGGAAANAYNAFGVNATAAAIPAFMLGNLDIGSTAVTGFPRNAAKILGVGSTGTGSGGFGIGGGGSAQNATAQTSANAGGTWALKATPEELLTLSKLGLRGGGGGGVYVSATTNQNVANGGGGGSVVMWVRQLVSTPVLSADGGIGAWGSVITGTQFLVGGAGVTQLIAV